MFCHRQASGASRFAALILALAAVCAPQPLPAQTGEAPGLVLQTNEGLIAALRRPPSFDIADPMAAFAAVFAAMKPEATVLPTENYYYFSFVHGGLTYVGNMRLDASDRDAGFLHFAYFPEYTQWKRGDDPTYRKLGPGDGLKLTRKGPLAYEAAFRGKTVLFKLNDLSAVKPPAGLLHANEKYLGPVFDESGVQFYLVFNPDVKVFHYILNEKEGPGDTLYKSEISDRIEIGARTGFAFYRDHHKERRILIGVNQFNSNVNNYYDGPFDQLPDNFLEGDALKEAIIAVAPDMAGRIDRYGNSPGGEERFFIGPYGYWTYEDDLQPFEDCAASKDTPRELYYACFAVEEEPGEDSAGDGADAKPEEAKPQGK